ncbi:Colicin V production protein [Candidatus Magnetomorum sp. HK-1]|nr:Colicin V production protein [Candidatus Magnetomorum sp. HK-1]
MNVLDFVIAGVVGFCLVRGLFRGLVKEISSIVGVFVGYYCACNYYKPCSDIVQEWNIINNPAYVKIIVFFCLFCSIFIVIGLVGIIIRYILREFFISWVDTAFGASFGTLKGVLITSVLLIPLTAFLPDDKLMKESVLAPKITIMSQVMVSLVPDHLKEKFNQNVDQLKSFWSPSI